VEVSREPRVPSPWGKSVGLQAREKGSSAPGLYPGSSVASQPLVTFRYHLYSKMNMNRNRRNPLKTNDPCTLYSIINRVLHNLVLLR